MILVIDNYDSFTYNLVQYLGMLDETVQVVRNDQITVDQVRERQPDQIVISPGPGRPEDAGITVEVIQRLGSLTPILGVCLGHQAIALAYGGEVVPAVRLMHGKADFVYHNGEGIFRNLPQGFPAGRYHSLAVNVQEVKELQVTAHCEDGTIMAITHKTHPVWGIQFHPESILTPSGMDLLQNFIHITSPSQVTHVNKVGGVTP
ncbi:MAG: aminodeoxychorismate/anthranilate synthase component II [Firmicutes bacterium]|nr:aminodeoxychorismate/anthranilate synthase component II [Bacillota bacterium]MCL5972562.1 aminodeoxychorismate/anthranilate synthase component II [Bacillota bacterium]